MNKGFSKKDLRTGHIVRFRDGETAILIGNEFKNSYQIDTNICCTCLEYYDEELLDEVDRENDIMEVHYIKSTDKTYDLKQLVFEIPKEHTELIWKREREIDWSKVPKWTKVIIKDIFDTKGNTIKNRYFLKVEEIKNNTIFFVTKCDKFTYTELEQEGASYIEIYDEKDIKEEWYK